MPSLPIVQAARGGIYGGLIGAVAFAIVGLPCLALLWGLEKAAANWVAAAIAISVISAFVGGLINLVMRRVLDWAVPGWVRHHWIFRGALVGGFMAAFVTAGFQAVHWMACVVCGAAFGGATASWLWARDEQRYPSLWRVAGYRVRRLRTWT